MTGVQTCALPILVANVADHITVMYAGRAVEQAGVYDIFAAPAHPYTKALLRSIPRVDMKGRELEVIAGRPPVLTDIPPGCAFHPRCQYAQDVCRTEWPELRDLGGGRKSACHFAESVLDGTVESPADGDGGPGVTESRGMRGAGV